MTPAQAMAIGTFGRCSGTLIGHRTVLSAGHCDLTVDDAFCIGLDPSAPDRCRSVARVDRHPRLDLTVVRLETAFEGVAPIAIAASAPTQTDSSERLELAGYGETEALSLGDRRFVAVTLEEITSDKLRFNGFGQGGACGGDSGGPALDLAPDGDIRVYGVLSHGSQSCVGRDAYVRIDVVAQWIESIGDELATPEPCRIVGAEGRCVGGRAHLCDGGRAVSALCKSPGRCGWDSDAQGFRCVMAGDPCDGVDGAGECQGSTVRRCVAGRLETENCRCSTQLCSVTATPRGAGCVPDPCEGVTFVGTCQGDVVMWCRDGAISTLDCASLGQTCGYINDEVGYFCAP